MGTVHDPADQLGMLRSVWKSAYRIRSAQQALGVLTRAAVDALSAPTGPVSVEVPIDLQRDKIERPAMLGQFRSAAAAAAHSDRGRARRTGGACRRGEAADCCGWVAAPRRPEQRRRNCWIWASAWSPASTAAARCRKTHPMNLGGLTGNGMPIIPEFYKSVDLCWWSAAGCVGKKRAISR